MAEASLDRAAFVCVALLAAVAPFERTTPLLRLPGQSITTVEAAVLLAVAAAGAAAAWRARFTWRTPLTAPWVAFVIACTAAAVVAPISRLNALHMAGRLAAAFGVFLATVNGVASRARQRALIDVLLAGAVVAAALTILEYLGEPSVLRVLTAFRPGLSTVGAQVRAGGPLQYPTIASMYLEVVFAIGVGGLFAAIDAAAIGRAAALWAALVAIAAAIVLTFTRAGLVTMAATLVVAGALRWRRHASVDRGSVAAAALAAAIVAVFAGSRSLDSLWLRFTSEGQEAWYRAAIEAPAQVWFAADAVRTVPVVATNTGRLVWDSRAESPFYFSYHWLSSSGDRVVAFEGIRTPFDTPIAPGETAALPVAVRAPRQPGDYRLVWDVVQEGRLWLTTEPGASASVSEATVLGPRSSDALVTAPLPRPTIRPGRWQLWRAAAAMLAAHPWLGVGPDNFRLSYGSYAGIAVADPRTHSNNMYLEVLAGSGAAGGALFAWLLWRAGRVARLADIGVACAALAVAVHGLVDSFLSFAPTYVLFAMALGLACVQARRSEIGSDAHRV